jgi:hypothetical protein
MVKNNIIILFNSFFGRLDNLSWEKLDGCLKGSLF